MYYIISVGNKRTEMTEAVSNVKQYKTWFEATSERDTADFEKFEDGSFRVAVEHGYEGREVFYMNAEQFAAFKKWVMEN